LKNQMVSIILKIINTDKPYF
jgi:hypothetical protein